MSHFNMLVFPPLVLPLTAKLGLSMAQVLELSFWMYLLFGVTALPWGFLADRLGAKPLLMLYFLGAGLSALGAAFTLDNPAVFSMFLAGIGLFAGIYHPAGLGLIARGIERISLGMAYNGIFGNLGLAAAPLLTGLINWFWGPSAAYFMLAFFNLAGLAMIFSVKLDEPPRKTAKEDRSTNGMLLPFFILLICMMLAGITYRGSTVTIPAYMELKVPDILSALQSVWPWDLSGNLLATLIMSLIFLVGALGQYLGGRIGDRFDPRWGYLAFHAISAPAVFLMAYTANLPLIGATLVYLFFLLGMQPMENTLVAKLSPPAFQHTAYGSKFVLTFGVGAAAVKLAGWLQETRGIESVFVAFGFVSLTLVAGICLLVWRTRPTTIHPSSGARESRLRRVAGRA